MFDLYAVFQFTKTDIYVTLTSQGRAHSSRKLFQSGSVEPEPVY